VLALNTVTGIKSGLREVKKVSGVNSEFKRGLRRRERRISGKGVCT
jgi:hypothetical protein